MKLGLCTSVENIALAAELGYDYIECALNSLAAASEEEYQQLQTIVRTASIPVTKCNCLLPASVPVCGPHASEQQQREYLEKAFSRAQSLGIKLAVFGSGGARKVPEGWSHVKAWEQIISFLHLLGEYGEKYDITIVIEPLRRKECNILNLVSEGTAMAAAVKHPRIAVLGDTFHMLSCHEPWDALTYAGEKLQHIHVSHALPDLSGRIYPAPGDGEDYAPLFDTLKAMHYQGDMSVEAGCKDLRTEGANALACLKQYL